METLTQSQQEHSDRAHLLSDIFDSEEELAEFLHKNYRAAAKSFRVPGPKHHDHGWCDCYGKAKKYFLRRAKWLLTQVPHDNGRI
jgi:hypothetical protein